VRTRRQIVAARSRRRRRNASRTLRTAARRTGARETALDRSVDDGIEGRDAVAQRRAAEAVAREQGREIALLTMQCHVIQDHRLDQQVHRVGTRMGCRLDRTVSAVVADLLAEAAGHARRIRRQHLRSPGRAEDQDDLMELMLVTPDKADIKKRKISIMAPIGAALIGFRQGEKVKWSVPGGKKTFTIVEVINEFK